MADEKKQNVALKALSSLGHAIKSYKQKVDHEQSLRDEYRQNHPEQYAKDWHIWGMEAPPSKIKMVESVAALALGYVGARSAYYGLTAATDKVYEKGALDGIFRQISGAVRSVFGIATLGIATMFAAHAWRINIPDTTAPNRTV